MSCLQNFTLQGAAGDVVTGQQRGHHTEEAESEEKGDSGVRAPGVALGGGSRY